MYPPASINPLSRARRYVSDIPYTHPGNVLPWAYLPKWAPSHLASGLEYIFTFTQVVLFSMAMGSTTFRAAAINLSALSGDSQIMAIPPRSDRMGARNAANHAAIHHQSTSLQGKRNPHPCRNVKPFLCLLIELAEWQVVQRHWVQPNICRAYSQPASMSHDSAVPCHGNLRVPRYRWDDLTSFPIHSDALAGESLRQSLNPSQ